MIEQVVDFLNEALEQDSEAINKVFLNINVPATEAMIEHPTIQVRMDKTLRLIGLINGLVSDGQTCIAMVFDDEGKRISKFIIRSVY